MIPGKFDSRHSIIIISITLPPSAQSGTMTKLSQGYKSCSRMSQKGLLINTGIRRIEKTCEKTSQLRRSASVKVVLRCASCCQAPPADCSSLTRGGAAPTTNTRPQPNSPPWGIRISPCFGRFSKDV